MPVVESKVSLDITKGTLVWGVGGGNHPPLLLRTTALIHLSSFLPLAGGIFFFYLGHGTKVSVWLWMLQKDLPF